MKKSTRSFLWLTTTILLLILAECSSGSLPLESETADNYDVAGTDGHYFKTVQGTKDGVEEFLNLLGDFDSKNKGTLTSGYKHNYDTCYNITPEKIILEKPECKIFKFSEDCLSVLQYEGELYVLGISFGGYGVVDMKLADINNDGENDLCYTFSWGSGIHRSHIAYFDFIKKAECLIDYVCIDNDMMIIEDEKGGLSLYHAYISSDDNTNTNFIGYSLESGKLLGKLVNNKDNVIVK